MPTKANLCLIGLPDPTWAASHASTTA